MYNDNSNVLSSGTNLITDLDFNIAAKLVGKIKIELLCKNFVAKKIFHLFSQGTIPRVAAYRTATLLF